jgi:hypothetical protein
MAAQYVTNPNIGDWNRSRSREMMCSMEHSPQLEAFFELCKDIYERRVREGTWPWTADSTNPQNVIDSVSNQRDL